MTRDCCCDEDHKDALRQSHIVVDSVWSRCVSISDCWLLNCLWSNRLWSLYAAVLAKYDVVGLLFRFHHFIKYLELARVC